MKKELAELQKGIELERAASAAIARLNALGANREASKLGDLLGNWRRGRIGDCLLLGAIETAIEKAKPS